jgi:hypothetical protein
MTIATDIKAVIEEPKDKVNKQLMKVDLDCI